jgi:hypothetical protein
MILVIHQQICLFQWDGASNLARTWSGKIATSPALTRSDVSFGKQAALRCPNGVGGLPKFLFLHFSVVW